MLISIQTDISIKTVTTYQSDAVSARILLNKNNNTYRCFEQEIALKNTVQTYGSHSEITVYFLYFTDKHPNAALVLKAEVQ